MCILEENFGTKTRARKQELERAIRATKLTKFDEGSVNAHIESVRVKINKLENYEGKLTDSEILDFMADTLPSGEPHFDNFADSLRFASYDVKTGEIKIRTMFETWRNR